MPSRSSLERRLLVLEEQYGGVGAGLFRAHRGDREERIDVHAEAIRHLTLFELTVFDQLMTKRGQHQDLSGADFYRIMTEVEHQFEREWYRIVRSILRGRAGKDEETIERREELRKRSIEELQDNPPPWWWQ